MKCPKCRAIALGCLFLLPACAPQGAGSIEAGRTGGSRIMVVPDRDDPGPAPPKTRPGRAARPATSPRR